MIATVKKRLCVTLLPQTMEVLDAQAKLAACPHPCIRPTLKAIAASSKQKALAFDLLTLFPRVLIGHEVRSPISAQKADWTGYQHHSTLAYKPYPGLYKSAVHGFCHVLSVTGCLLSVAVFLGVTLAAFLAKGLAKRLGHEIHALKAGIAAAKWVGLASQNVIDAVGTGLYAPLRASDKGAKVLSRWLHGDSTSVENAALNDGSYEMTDVSHKRAALR